jgi:hypothetical protein
MERSELTASQTPHYWHPVTRPPCRWNAGGRMGAPSQNFLVMPRPIISLTS